MDSNTYPPYARYAEIYDQDQGDFTRRVQPYLDQVLNHYACHPASALDLACGTGTLSLNLAARGVEAMGLDLAPSMVKVAQQKARSRSLKVPFICCDMRDLDLGHTFDLVTCFYDSLNYLLTLRDIKSVFRSVSEHLNSDGLFIFDMNSVHCLRHVWGDRTEAQDDDDLPYIWRSSYDPKRRLSTLHATFFVRRGKCYEKFTEVHIERGYPQSQIVRALEQAGFGQVDLYDWGDLSPAHRKTNRILYVARKVKLESL